MDNKKLQSEYIKITEKIQEVSQLQDQGEEEKATQMLLSFGEEEIDVLEDIGKMYFELALTIRQANQESKQE